MKKTLLAALFLSASIFSSSVFAADNTLTNDGTINFAGKIVATTCKVDSTNTQDPLTVTLPTINKSLLAEAGNINGETKFQIQLKGCTASTAQTGPNKDINTVRAFFNGNNINQNGRLTNKSGNGYASNVDIQILNANKTVLNLSNQDIATQDAESAVTLTNKDNISLVYYARYYATGTATEGDVETSVNYTIIYN